MDAKHTALPWSGRSAKGSIEIVGANGERIAEMWLREATKSDREFIVRACNAHDELVKAFGELAAMVDAGTSPDYRALQEHIAMRRARAAISKATGAA